MRDILIQRGTTSAILRGGDALHTTGSVEWTCGLNTTWASSIDDAVSEGLSQKIIDALLAKKAEQEESAHQEAKSSEWLAEQIEARARKSGVSPEAYLEMVHDPDL